MQVNNVVYVILLIPNRIASVASAPTIIPNVYLPVNHISVPIEPDNKMVSHKIVQKDLITRDLF